MPRLDPGLQPQRTSLAWSRTVMALGVNAIFAVRVVFEGDRRLAVYAGLMMLCTVGSIFLLARTRRLELGGFNVSIPASRSMAVTAFLTASVAIVGIVAIFL